MSIKTEHLFLLLYEINGTAEKQAAVPFFS